jgi:cytidylate kinase
VSEAQPSATAPPGLVVAIDGPSGSGKSTVARGVARALSLRYLDTGAMYRAVTWRVLHQGVDLTDSDAIAATSVGADLVVSTDPDESRVAVDGVDVSTEIRGQPVTAAVSAVSAVPAVRAEMVRRQQELIGPGDIVVEGRDIGTVVTPDAAVKVFLTADASARASRRGRELVGGPSIDPTVLAATQEALRSRDAADSSRAASPLTQADDAHVIDSTGMTADEVVGAVLALIAEAR